MNEDSPHYIELIEETPKNRFPIMAQLGILVFVMFAIFGPLLFQKSPDEPTLTDINQNIGTILNEEKPVSVPQKIEGVQLRASAAFVWDIEGQRALFSKNSETALPLASITKLMTALIGYELFDENKNTTVSMSAIKQEGSSGLFDGEVFKAKDLSEMALVSSSNDAAYALAANVGSLLGSGDPTSQFIKGMNIRADELGLETMEFKNMTGLDISSSEPGAVGSAKDVSFLMEYIITNYPEILEPTQESSARVYNAAGAYHEVENTNEITNKIPNMIGSKTGYTDLAGGNLTIAFDAGLNRPVIITVLGSTREERFSDVLKLVAAVQKSVSQ